MTGATSNFLTALAWDGTAWAPNARPKEVADNCRASSFRLATMNILTDICPRVVQLAIASERRFERLVVEIERLDSTVVGLNEVTSRSLEVLLASEFIRRRYFVSERPDNINGTLISSHSVVLLSKLPFEDLYALDVDNLMKRKPIVGVVRWSGELISMCAVHTSAFQNQEGALKRAKQIRDVTEFLKTLKVTARFILGDLNMHCLAEDSVIGNNNLLDLWAESHFSDGGDHNPGYTFDVSTNGMIPRYIPGECRRMRLDRILCFKGDRMAPAGACKMWGCEAVDAASDVFLSDHYGLVVDLIMKPDGFQGCPQVQALLEKNGEMQADDYNGFGWRFFVALVPHLFWLPLRILGLT